MALIVKVSQKAMNTLASLPKEVQVKARRAVEFLKSGNEKAIKPSSLRGGRKLYSGRLNNKYRIIYSKNESTIIVVDFIKLDTVSNVMRSES